METSMIAIFIVVFVIILYVTEIIPLAATSVCACLAMGIFGVIPFKELYAGFGNDVVVMVVGVMILGEALFESGVAKVIGKKTLDLVGNNEKTILFAIVLITAFLSAFLSNTATVAMFIPIISSIAANSGGKITKKNTFMALGFAAVAGGSCTLVGSTPQLIAQGILEETGCNTMGFFDLAFVGVPKVLVIALYFSTIGYWLQKKVFNFPEREDKIPEGESNVNKGDDNTNEKTSYYERIKKIIPVTVMFFCVIGFVTQIWTVGTVALLGAVICVLTGCISLEKAFNKIDWATVIILGSSITYAKGLDVSGGGEMIAKWVIGLLGVNPSPVLVLCLLAGVAAILGNIMSQTATTAMLTPIGITMALKLGIEPTTIAIAIVSGANVAYMTPVATPPITMTLVAGYRFLDYVKVGALLNVFAFLTTVAAIIFLV